MNNGNYDNGIFFYLLLCHILLVRRFRKYNGTGFNVVKVLA